MVVSDLPFLRLNSGSVFLSSHVLAFLHRRDAIGPLGRGQGGKLGRIGVK